MSESGHAGGDVLAEPATPLEAAQFSRYSTSAEITDYLHRLAASSPFANAETWGYSVNGKALVALHVRLPQASATGHRLKVLLVGSHHGASEAAGGEALLVIARELLSGSLHGLLQHIECWIYPNANPDGRDGESNKNANGIDLNRDYVLLSQPESRALDHALARIRPDVVLDAHESAALKRRSLGREGYMTGFQAQMETANNPGIPADIRDFCEQRIMNPVLEAIAAQGMHAQRYIKEIGSTRQPLTHGILTARAFRNKAGLCGALPFLLETSMEPKDGRYPTFRNIAVRRDKQLLCMRQFLTHVCTMAGEISAFNAQIASPEDTTILDADFVEHPSEPVTHLPLRHIETDEIIDIEFVNHRHMQLHAPIRRPACYYITQHTELFSHYLRRHLIDFEVTGESAQVAVESLTITRRETTADEGLTVKCEETTLEVLPGCLRVSLDQTRGLLVPQLLEPQSSSSLFRYERFFGLCREGVFFVVRGERH